MQNKGARKNLILTMVAVVLCIMLTLTTAMFTTSRYNGILPGDISGENGSPSVGGGVNAVEVAEAPTGAAQISTDTQLKAWLKGTGYTVGTDAYKHAVLTEKTMAFDKGDENYMIAAGRTLHGNGKTITLTDTAVSTARSTAEGNATGVLLGSTQLWSSNKLDVTLRGSFLYLIEGTLSSVNFNATVDVNIDEGHSNNVGRHSAHGVIVGLNSGTVDNVSLNMTGHYKIQSQNTRGAAISVGGIAGDNAGTIQYSTVTLGTVDKGAALESYINNLEVNKIGYALAGGMVGRINTNGKIINAKVTINRGLLNGNKTAIQAFTNGDDGGIYADKRFGEAYAGGLIGAAPTISGTGSSATIDGAIFNNRNALVPGDWGAGSIEAMRWETGSFKKGVFAGYSNGAKFTNLVSYNANDHEILVGGGNGYTGVTCTVVKEAEAFYKTGDKDNLHFNKSGLADNQIIFTVTGTAGGNVSVYNQYVDNSVKTVSIPKSKASTTQLKFELGTAYNPSIATKPIDATREYGTGYAYNAKNVLGLPETFTADISSLFGYYNTSGDGTRIALGTRLDAGEYNIKITPSSADYLYIDTTNRVLIKSLASDQDHIRENITVTHKEIDIDWTVDDFTYTGEDRKDVIKANYVDLDGSKIYLDVVAPSAFKDWNAFGYDFKLASEDTSVISDGQQRNYRVTSDNIVDGNYVIKSPMAEGIGRFNTYNIKKETYKGINDLKINRDPFEYDGSAHSLVLLDAVGAPASLPTCIDNALTISWEQEGSITNTAIDVADGVKNIKAVITSTSTNYEPIGGKDYNDDDINFIELSGDLEITPYNAIITWTDKVFTYNTFDQKDDISASFFGVNQTLFTLVPTTELGEFKSFVDGGYDFTVEMPNTNYASTNATRKYVMNKKEVDISKIAFGATIFDYTGNVISLDLDISQSMKTFVTLTYDNDINSATNAGTYPITARISLINDENSVMSGTGIYTQNLVINRLTYDITGVEFASGTAVYNGEPQSLTSTGTLPTGISSSVDGGAQTHELTASYSYGTNAGAHTISMTFENQSSNYEPLIAKTAVLTISPYDIISDVSWSDNTFKYTGSPQNDDVKFNFLGTEFAPAIEGGAKCDVDFTAYNDNQGYLFTASIAGGNYTVNASIATKTYNMGQATVKLEGVAFDSANTRFDYNGTPQGVSFINMPAAGVAVVFTGTEKATVVGNYNVSAVLSAKDTNYILEGTTDIAQISWSIEKIAYTVSEEFAMAAKEVTYTGVATPLVVTGKIADSLDGTALTIVYSAENNMTDVVDGGHTVTATITGGSDNYKAFEVVLTSTLAIKPAGVTIDWVAGDLKYTGSDIKTNITASYDSFVAPIAVTNISVDGGEFINYRENGYTFTATIEDTNYVITENETSNFNIVRLEIDMNNVLWPSQSIYNYVPDSIDRVMKLTGVPEDLLKDVSYTGNTGHKTDKYTAIVTFEVLSVNHIVPASFATTFEWEIIANLVDLPKMSFAAASPIDFDNTFHFLEVTYGELGEYDKIFKIVYSYSIGVYTREGVNEDNIGVKNAATYTVRATYVSNDVNLEASEKFIETELIINQAKADIVWGDPKVYYNGTNQADQITFTYLDVDNQFIPMVGDVVDGGDFTEYRESGYNVEANLTDPNYVIGKNKTKNIMMNKCEVEIDWTADEFVYTNTDYQDRIKASYKSAIEGEDPIALTVVGLVEMINWVDGGYTFTASIEAANYVLTPGSETNSMTYKVKQADYDDMSDITITHDAFEYNGEAHSLVLSGDLAVGHDGVALGVVWSDNNSIINVSEGNKSVTATITSTSTNYKSLNLVIEGSLKVKATERDVEWAVNDHVYDGVDGARYIWAKYIDILDEETPLVVKGPAEFIEYKDGGYEFKVKATDSNYVLKGADDNGYASKIYMINKAEHVFNNEQVTTSYTKNSITVSYSTGAGTIEWSLDDGATYSSTVIVGLTEMTEYKVTARLMADNNHVASEAITMFVTTNYTISDFEAAALLVGEIKLSNKAPVDNVLAIFNKLSETDQVALQDDCDAIVGTYNDIVNKINKEIKASVDVAKNNSVPVATAALILGSLGLIALAGVSMKKFGGRL